MTATKLSTPFLLAAALLFSTACDAEEVAPTEERAAELDAEVEPCDKGEGHENGRMNPAERLCEEIACSDEQRGQIEALMKRQHEARRAAHGERDVDGDPEARREAHAAVNAKLAEAFRATQFDASVLGSEREGKRDPSAHIDAMAQFVVELHGLLSPEQRGQLGKLMEARGPQFLGGARAHHGKRGGGEHHHGKQGKRSPEARLAHHVERVCEPLA